MRPMFIAVILSLWSIFLVITGIFLLSSPTGKLVPDGIIGAILCLNVVIFYVKNFLTGIGMRIVTILLFLGSFFGLLLILVVRFSVAEWIYFPLFLLLLAMHILAFYRSIRSNTRI
ncbi:hypothetical protein [Xanthocytophaga flava]|uniref:hypothetical protein n=1 Tax=Xanthocytophaga flava TaxID=3048013 RepID=UPI0028D80CC8|nr:hypothetical protein [Xanthocytophaga flavus]MDJ1470294.1 hypothetical protein [Xanthocytophaga flavus]